MSGYDTYKYHFDQKTPYEEVCDVTNWKKYTDSVTALIEMSNLCFDTDLFMYMYNQPFFYHTKHYINYSQESVVNIATYAST